MPRRSNKWIAEILTPSISSSLSPSVETMTDVHTSSRSSIRNNNIHDITLDRKITIVTEGFTTRKFCELVLRDRSRLSKENALTICDYIIAMKREINPRLSYKKNTIQILSDLSRAVGIEKKFIDMIRDDVLSYLDKCRKSENEDPLHKWIGTYNLGVVVLCRFFKWLYNPDDITPFYSFTSRSMGIDLAYRSSAFGIVVTQWVDGIVQILYAEEYHRPDYNEMLSTVYSLMSKYDIDMVYVDGANPSFIKSLKLQIGEDPDYDEVLARYRSEGLGDATKDMRIVPVNFKSEHKAMLGHCKMLLEKDGGRIATNPDRFDKLITALRTAVDNDGTLDKESTSYNDIFDAFRLAMKFYRFEESSS